MIELIFMLKIATNFDQAVLLSGTNLEVSFSLLNVEDMEHEVRPYISLRVNGKQEVLTIFDFEKIPPGGQREYKVKLKIPEVVGEGVLGIYSEEKDGTTKGLEFPVFIADKGAPIYVSFVWHHHQAPQYYPEGTFKDLWAYKHVLEGDFEGFKKGPYSVHLAIHGEFQGFSDVDHFSPSLLEQWEMVVSGDRRIPPEVIQRKEEIRELMDTIRHLVSQGRIEPMGSVYAHTVLGFVLKKAREKNLLDEAKKLLSWEITQGLTIVENAVGKRPKGFWTPEMFWSMELVDIYREHNILYTVLCQQHFEKASGEKGTIYEPYIVRNPETSNDIIVFFRDLALSNWISFNVDFKDEEEADMAARRFVIELAKRRLTAPGGIVVIALDGENWMIIPQYRRFAPYFLKRIIEYIEKSQVIKTTTLEQYLQGHKPSRVLTYVPYGSWVNLSESQWTGGVKDEMWEEAFKALTVVFSLYRIIGENAQALALDRSTELFQAMKALAIAFDSDFYWYGEVHREREFVRRWAQRSIEIAENFAKKYMQASIVEKADDHLVIQLENKSPYSLHFSIFVEDNGFRSETLVKLEPNSNRRITVYTPLNGSPKVVVKAGAITLPVAH
ncbi:glycoside hydrolase family 57 protein [Infirmifilum sp. NZ]|uniref:glycoside hydrolase family 57 protein n=1 Tax=Infirmifilum sp. NZ TaxID=2926850 RepID=UPI002799D5F8|nr:glycoside hydrolase family 57 protein [Infirmifilum sp. NZ]UNQ74170.1 glycoside hydrolase family 57 protein [Infirmifilum sp. NZ]